MDVRVGEVEGEFVGGVLGVERGDDAACVGDGEEGGDEAGTVGEEEGDDGVWRDGGADDTGGEGAGAEAEGGVCDCCRCRGRRAGEDGARIDGEGQVGDGGQRRLHERWRRHCSVLV